MLLVMVLVVLAILAWPSRSPFVPATEHSASSPEVSRPLLVEIADATDLVALALGAGGGVVDSLGAVARVSPPEVAADLGRVVAALQWGRSMRDAWTYAGPGWRATATALVVADECGAPSATVLAEAATRVREQESRRLEAATGRAGVMLVVPLGLCFLPAFIATSVVPMIVVLLGEQLG